MVVDDFYIVSIPITPEEANSPPVIDPDAMLSFSIAFQRLQAVSWRYEQKVQVHCGVKLNKFAQSHSLDVSRKPSRSPPPKQLLSILVRKGLDHDRRLTRFVNNVKR